MKFRLTKKDVSEDLDYNQLNNRIFKNVSSNFLSMLKKLDLNEEIYHNDTGYKIRKIEK